MGWLQRGARQRDWSCSAQQLAFAVALIVVVSGTQLCHAREVPRRQLQDEVVRKLTSAYMSNEDLAYYMADFVKRCSSISKLISIGKSVDGFPILALEMSTHPGQDVAKPQVKYVGNIHGDEPSGRQLLLLVAETLCAEHQQAGSAAHKLLQSIKLVLMPTMNPDGFALHRRGNKNNVDLNRNFPDPIKNKDQDLRQPVGHEQIETLNMMNYTLHQRFVASLVVHEGALVANYPFDGYTDGSMQVTGQRSVSPDDSAFVHMATTYANLHTTMHNSGEFKQGITNGAQWYPVYGGMQDWNYLAANCMEVTLELNNDKWPAPSRLAVMWDENKAALLEWPLKTVMAGLRGVVKGNQADQAGLVPLKATISVHGIDHNTTSSAEFGDYYRILTPGEYTVTVAAPGYTPSVAQVKVPQDGSGLVRDWTLALEGTTVPEAQQQQQQQQQQQPSKAGDPTSGSEAGQQQGSGPSKGDTPLPTHEEGGWVVLGGSGKHASSGWGTPYVWVPLGTVVLLGVAFALWQRRSWAHVAAGYAQLLPMQQFPRPTSSGGRSS